MSGDTDPWLVTSDPWLSQGDVFAQIPVWQAGMLSQQTIVRGPALLVTRSCDLDKAKNNGQPAIEFLNFLPLQSFSELHNANRNKAEELRRRALEGTDTPYSVLYLDDIPQIGEVPEADHRRLIAGANDTRVGRLGDPLANLFVRKWIIHWTGLSPAQDADV